MADGLSRALRESCSSTRAAATTGQTSVLTSPTVAEADCCRMDEWKTDLWNLAGIPSPPNDHETNEAIVFGYIVAWFLGEVRCYDWG